MRAHALVVLLLLGACDPSQDLEPVSTGPGPGLVAEPAPARSDDEEDPATGSAHGSAAEGPSSAEPSGGDGVRAEPSRVEPSAAPTHAGGAPADEAGEGAAPRPGPERPPTDVTAPVRERPDPETDPPPGRGRRPCPPRACAVPDNCLRLAVDDDGCTTCRCAEERARPRRPGEAPPTERRDRRSSERYRELLEERRTEPSFQSRFREASPEERPAMLRELRRAVRREVDAERAAEGR